ncbi:MAG TPA: molybdopterin-binding protein [Kofleriaceae bacterium]|nr:molybdopterin-binding protein [Kofleriaceae bacterium]
MLDDRTRANIEVLVSTPSVHLAVLVVATDPAKADLGTAMIVRGRANGAGHQIVQQTVTKDAEANIRSNLARWVDDPNIDVVLVIGAVESDAVPSAIRPLVTQKLEGFTDLFRYLAFQELGAGAMLSNAEAAQCNSTFVFVLPGGVGAVGTAMDKLIIPQLDHNTQPKNLVAQMPRLATALVEADMESVDEAVPAAVAPEKTAGGSGVPAKLPAGRAKPGTARNVIRRPQDDPPTKQIELAKLERGLASSRSPNDAQTKPAIDLRKMLPKLPPGASHDPDTDVELLAAPPPPLAGTARIDTSPPIPPPRALSSMKGNAFNAKEGTSPGTPAPTGSKPIPSLTGIKGNAFDAKEGTSPGAAPAKPSTGTRSRPISVPPTNAFGKEGTSPGTSAPMRDQTAKTNIGGRDGTSPGTFAPRDPTGRTNIGNADPTGRTNIGNADPTSRTNALSRDDGRTQVTRDDAQTFVSRDEAKTTVSRDDRTKQYPRDEAPTTRRDDHDEAPTTRREDATGRVIPLTQDDARTKIFAKEGTSPGSPAPARGTGPSPVASAPSASSSRRQPTGPAAVAPPPPPAPAARAASAKSEPVKIAPTKAEPKESQRPISSGMLGLPSSQIFANAANEAAPLKANGAVKPSSVTPSVEMAPLVDATLEEDDEDLDDEALLAKAKAAHAAEEAVTVPRKDDKPNDKPREKAPPPTRRWEPTQKVDPMPVSAEMRSSSGELPIGTFQYPVQKRSGSGLKWLLLLFALGAGFGAAVFVAPKLMNKGDEKKPAAQVAQTTQPTQPVPPTPPPPPETGSAAADVPQAGSATTPETTTNTPTTNTPTTNTQATNTQATNTQATNTPSTNQTKRGGTQTKRGGTTSTTGGAVTSPSETNTTTTTTTTTQPTNETKPPPSGDPTCDEVGCVLSKYDRPCCERYKPKDTDIAKRSGDLPEDLDRQAVRAGIEKVKPAVVQCGEKAGVNGTVKIAVSVAPEGNVTSSEVADSPDAALGSCVATAIKRATFAKSVNGGTFTYPFVF